MNPRTLRDFHDTLASLPRHADTFGAAAVNPAPRHTAAFDPAAVDSAAPINAADLIARFRESGLLSDVSRRTVGPVPTGAVNAPAPPPLLRKPVLDKSVALKPAAPRLEPANRPGDPTNRPADPANAFSKAGPPSPMRVAELLDRHPDIAAQSPRTGHRAEAGRPNRARGHRPNRARRRALAALRPAPSIRVAMRPVLTVAAIVTVFAVVEAPNLLTNSHAYPANGSRTTTAAGPANADTPISNAASNAAVDAGTVTEPALPRPGLTRVSRSTRRAIGAAAHHVPLMKPGQTVPGTWIRPSSGRYTSCFCSRWGSFHAGIDLASKLGTPILAVGDGTVLKAGPASGFGNWVVIQHSNGDVSIYGHMKYFFVHAGQKVKAGEKIAVVGDQGFSTGPHLHFEVHKGGLGGTKINPIPWLKARGIVIGPLSKDG